MHSLTQDTTEVKNPEWITVPSTAWAWGLADSMNGLSSNEGFKYFAGAALTDYLNGWDYGFQLRIRNLFGWEARGQVDPDVRRSAILKAAKGAADYITARTAQDCAFYHDRELYACWPVQYRPGRFNHTYMSNRTRGDHA